MLSAVDVPKSPLLTTESRLSRDFSSSQMAYGPTKRKNGDNNPYRHAGAYPVAKRVVHRAGIVHERRSYNNIRSETTWKKEKQKLPPPHPFSFVVTENLYFRRTPIEAYESQFFFCFIRTC